MNEVLEPLTQIPGVRLMALITPDGVPITVQEGRAARTNTENERDSDELLSDFAASAGLAAGWLGQVGRATDPLTWSRPRRAVLRGSRGTLIMSRDDSAILMVITDQGIGAEELRLPMESVLARMQRHLNGGRRQKPAETNDSKDNGTATDAGAEQTPSALPTSADSTSPVTPDSGNENRFHEVNGDN